MSNEERKRIIDEALHGARPNVEAATEYAPVLPSGVTTGPRSVTPCCDHCSLKMGSMPPMTTQSAPANPYSIGGGLSGTYPTLNKYVDTYRQVQLSPLMSQLSQNYLSWYGNGNQQLAQSLYSYAIQTS